MTRRSTPLLAALALSLFALPAAACDFHGAGYGSLSGANWKPYSPQVSTTDPALMAAEATPVDAAAQRARMAARKPSFSTAASRASARALMRRDSAKAKTAEVKRTKTKPAAPAAQRD